MADFTITIPDEKVADVVAAFKSKFHYEETLEDGTANTESGQAFAKRMLIEHIKNITKKHLRNEASKAIDFNLE